MKQQTLPGRKGTSQKQLVPGGSQSIIGYRLSRRALIGFPHPKALGGVLLHVVQRPD